MSCEVTGLHISDLWIYFMQFDLCFVILNLQSGERCCVAVKFLCGWMRCNRKRSQRVLNAHLERLTLLKKLNVAICDEDPHMGICLFHWRLINYGKPGVALTNEELNSWEADETRLEKCEHSEDSMLEGVESHFERLPVRASDAIVHFIYTAKNRMNTVE
ncbi:hypothetical protein ANCDUO_03400 [Ancylostoma duodenale]|uniref:Uncharacterized protein n=1 Tax=Ancylostoma duodenale TaxID=51022 RepID=A0A0C2GXL5_9BILA|nr:hypothetical protein ANCDUO_03400 [Ancylostoma duodenale]